MARSPKILAFAGSAREGSYNAQLVRTAARAAEAAGAETTVADLREFPMPIFNEDEEKAQGLPDGAVRFRALMKSHDAFLIASPEYNSSISPLLKNVIDWGSRGRAEGEPPLAAYRGKVAALFAASPGKLGGLRGLVHVCSILQNIGVTVIPQQLAVSEAHRAFGDDGKLQDSGMQSRLESIAGDLVDVVRKLHG